ncbi:MAG: hypothetical protein M1835_005800 [Candelina submexicana]|nr:MAG: hypothetical protein M1835_005800 [Candelina submexicana]
MKPNLPRRQGRLATKETLVNTQKVSKAKKDSKNHGTKSTRKGTQSFERIIVESDMPVGLGDRVPNPYYGKGHADSFRGPNGKMRYHWGDGTYVTRIKLRVRGPESGETLYSEFQRLNLGAAGDDQFQRFDEALDIDRTSLSKAPESASLGSSEGAADTGGDSEMSGSS